MRYVLEIIIAVLAVYGGYTALHELAALLVKYWLSEKEETPKKGSEHHSGRTDKRKERSCRARRHD